MSPDLRLSFREACLPSQRLRDAAGGAFVLASRLPDWFGWMGEAAGMLSAEERHRVARLRRESDRANRIIAYALHRLLLSQLLDCAPGEVPLERDEKGCPRLPRKPYATSLSHGGEYVAIGVSASGPIGVDIEPTDRAGAMPEICRSLLHPDDREASGSADPAALLALWTRKEAVLKAAGIGLERDMNGFAVPDGVSIALPAHPRRSIRARSLRIPGVAIAVACAPEADPVPHELRAQVTPGSSASALHTESTLSVLAGS